MDARYQRGKCRSAYTKRAPLLPAGLAGANHSLTKAMYTPMLTFSTNLLAGVFSDNGGAVATVWPDRETVEGYAVQLAGPGNLIG